jgi:hypothetical protein
LGILICPHGHAELITQPAEGTRNSLMHGLSGLVPDAGRASAQSFYSQ